VVRSWKHSDVYQAAKRRGLAWGRSGASQERLECLQQRSEAKRFVARSLWPGECVAAEGGAARRPQSWSLPLR
jgi:hypothetical protein